MDKTQAFDPNRTVIGGGDLYRTQAMSAAPGFDPNKTGVMNPAAAPGLVVSLLAGRSATMANGPAREQFLIELAAGMPESLPGLASAGPRTPLNLCLVIDRSGSMEGPPLEYVKQACNYVVDMLSPQDILSIVTFEEIVEVLMPPQRVTAKQPIKDGIARLTPGNTTNLYDGIALALAQVLSVQDSGRATRMVVLSDGDPTAGIKDFSALVQHAGDVRSKGVTATFLGFGPDYNEELLASMAKRAGGNYYYIPRPELIPEIFRSELDKVLNVAAQSVRMEFKLARWVNFKGAPGHNVAPGAREFTLELADLERGAALQQILDLEFPNHPLGHYRVAAGRLTYTDPAAGATVTQDLDLVMEFTADSARYSAPVDPRVAAAFEVASVSKTVERTIMGLKTGQITAMGAIDELQKTQMILAKDGRTAEAQEVTLALRALQSGDTAGAEKTLMGTKLSLDQGKIQG